MALSIIHHAWLGKQFFNIVDARWVTEMISRPSSPVSFNCMCQRINMSGLLPSSFSILSIIAATSKPTQPLYRLTWSEQDVYLHDLTFDSVQLYDLLASPL